MSLDLSLTTLGLDAAMARLAALGGFHMAELADAAGALLESSARARFETRQAPDGAAWAPWSEHYAETRKDHHSLLVNEGDLRDSIASYSGAGEVRVGSNMIYAAHQHFGGEDGGIPARPYLGVSAQDQSDLHDLVTTTLAEVFA